MKKKVVYVALSVLAAIAVATFGAGWFMLDYALKPAPDRGDMAKRYAMVYREYPCVKPWVDSLKAVHALRDTFVTMAGGERHHAVYVRNPMSAGRTAILVHGYRDSHAGMLPIAKVYADMGYNILLPDLHAHGLSDGDEIQMGWKDREDVMRWIRVADTLFASAGARPSIVLHGVSMGAATVMNVAGEKLPPAVKCFVEDCGYTSVWDEFSHQLGEQFGLPDFPVLYAASMLCKLRYGWTFGEAAPVRQLAGKEVPMLYIHGSSDDYVPSWMLFPLYNANATYVAGGGKVRHFNDIWVTPGCAHAQSYKIYPSRYADRVAAFVGEHIR